MNWFTTTLSFTDVLVRLVSATLIGAALGLNREIRGKPAGLRTHALVALGTALVTLTGIELAGHDGEFDSNSVSRVIQGIVAGIGFLGGGTILKADSGQHISGLTTAASLWVVACLGIACGVGLWQMAIVAVLLALVVLIVGEPLENALHRWMGSRGKG
ncbi:MgtC/SapB family protein [Longimicrobium sp.]|uniref:MgtC/SapB family protein n=1 Tax=Longimicrobium sp. TaxID=2029185 RepID=UPI002E31EF30|nr:MgtC/SapB family protein [Longimicrobium sp.]HEX6039486.1 MgtC/SapB family protein [Longimicrobium sp.]